MSEKIKIAKKAYRVWVHSDIGEYPVFSKYDVEVIYADNATKAKSHCNYHDGKNEDGDDARWIDIKCIRAKEYDKIEYNGNLISRKDYKLKLAEEKRNKKLQELDETDLYYVQDDRGYVGNAVSWWAHGGSGYTCKIKNAHKYTKDEVIKDFTNGRETDVIWSARHVDANISEIVDVQNINRAHSY